MIGYPIFGSYLIIICITTLLLLFNLRNEIKVIFSYIWCISSYFTFTWLFIKDIDTSTLLYVSSFFKDVDMSTLQYISSFFPLLTLIFYLSLGLYYIVYNWRYISTIIYIYYCIISSHKSTSIILVSIYIFLLVIITYVISKNLHGYLVMITNSPIEYEYLVMINDSPIEYLVNKFLNYSPPGYDNRFPGRPRDNPPHIYSFPGDHERRLCNSISEKLRLQWLCNNNLPGHREANIYDSFPNNATLTPNEISYIHGIMGGENDNKYEIVRTQFRSTFHPYFRTEEMSDALVNRGIDTISKVVASTYNFRNDFRAAIPLDIRVSVAYVR